MKVILKEEVYNLGLAGDVVDVADGYGRNYLIPRGMAIRATDGAMKEAEAITRARKMREAKTVDDARETADAMEERTLRIEARVDEAGTLYGSVGRSDVHRVLKERGFDVDERKIDLKGTLKEIGEYEVPVQVHPQVQANVIVEIVDVEGKVGIGEPEPSAPPPEVEVDEDAVSEAAAAASASESSLTDAQTLAEQALEAAREYEQSQAVPGADEDAEPAEDAELIREGELVEAVVEDEAEDETEDESGGGEDAADESDEEPAAS